MYSDDGTINLRDTDNVDEEPEFQIEHIDEDEAPASDFGTPVSEPERVASSPHDKVKIKFDKFVDLVATHAYEDIFERHADEDVIIGTDLLADLANAHEEKSDRKGAMIFVFGIALGIALAWIFFKT